MLLNHRHSGGHGDVLPRAVGWMDAHPEVGVMGPRVLSTDGNGAAVVQRVPSLKHLAKCRNAGPDPNPPPRPLIRMTGWDRTTESAPVEVISGAAMVARRAAMEEVGLLDRRAFFFLRRGNRLVRHRFARAGWELRFVPNPPRSRISAAGAVGKLNHKRDVLMTEGTTRLHRKHGGWSLG